MNTFTPLDKPLASDWHILSPKFKAQFTLRGDRLECEWRPHKPRAREMLKMVKRYRVARDTFLEGLSERTGQRIAVLELPQ